MKPSTRLQPTQSAKRATRNAARDRSYSPSSPNPIAKGELVSSPSIQRLFSSITNPLEAQALFNTWKSGLQAEVERLTPSMLPTALLAANVARLSFRTDIVDDYARLFERVKQEYEQREIPRFWHPEGFLVSALVFNHGPRSDYDVSEVRDAQYVHQAVKLIFDL